MEEILHRPVEVLRGYRAIAEAFCHNASAVREWRKMGAPIYLDSRKIPRAEKGEMWEWYKKNIPARTTSQSKKKKPSSPD